MNQGKRGTVDVLIIGAGPAGATLAIDLVRRGLDVCIVDKATGSFGGSRAKGVQPRTLEVLEDLGVLDEILTGGSPYPPLGIHFGPLVVPWRMLKRRTPTASVPFPNTWLVPQYRTDRALHARLHALGNPVRLATTLVRLLQTPTRVTATLEGPNGEERVTARYVVGADGGASTVRNLLGIKFAGSTDEGDRMVIADIAVTGLSRKRWHVWPGRGGRFVGACPLPHSELFQWMIRLAPGEEPMLDHGSLVTRIHAHTRDAAIRLGDVRWTSVFRPNIRLADRFQDGRVFLAGDAAHVHTPAGAQGLNTGIQDAYNLGWKLGQVLQGADERLLSSYEAERRPVAAAVLGLSTKRYEAMSKLSTSGIRRGNDEQQLRISYRGGPLATSRTEHTATLRVGDRAPDAELTSANGNRVRLFETYRGPHFTAVACGARSAGQLDRLEWPSKGAPLKRVVIDAEGGAADVVGRDEGGAFRRAYGVSGDALLLIRPDGYVGHIAIRDGAETADAIRAMTPATAHTEADRTTTARS